MTELTNTSTPPSLDEILDTYSGDAADEGFTVDSEEKAIWAAEKLVAAHAEIAAHQLAASQRIALMNQWLTDVTRPLAARVEFFEGMLDHYHREVFAADSKKKTIPLPGVQLKSRAGQDAWAFDADLFLAWADEHAPELVRVKREPNAAEAKKALTAAGGGVAVNADGVVVAGVVITPGETKFSIVVA